MFNVLFYKKINNPKSNHHIELTKLPQLTTRAQTPRSRSLQPFPTDIGYERRAGLAIYGLLTLIHSSSPSHCLCTCAQGNTPPSSSPSMSLSSASESYDNSWKELSGETKAQHSQKVQNLKLYESWFLTILFLHGVTCKFLLLFNPSTWE